MKAEDLKRWPLLFKKFKKNIKKHGIYGSYEEFMEDSNEIIDAFEWGDTKQKHSFWSALDDGDIEAAKALQPKLFSIYNQVTKVNISSYELPEEVWIDHGIYSPYSIEGPLWTMAQKLSCIEGVLEVSYKTSNHVGIHFKVKGGDPLDIAEVIYMYRPAGLRSVGNLTCTFETKLGEIKQESFDYVY